MARRRADSAGERLGRARGEAAEFRGEANRLWEVETGRKARGGRRDVDGAPLGSARLELEEGEEERRKGNVASGRGQGRARAEAEDRRRVESSLAWACGMGAGTVNRGRKWFNET